MRIAIAGGAEFFVNIARHLAAQGIQPALLILFAEKDVERLKGELSGVGAPFLVTEDLHSDAAKLREARLDLLISIEYPQILKKSVLEIPRLGCVNLHPSALPKYKGRHPVTWALINGEPEIGITLHFMNEQIDEGEIILQDFAAVGRDDDCLSVQARLLELGKKMVEQGVRQICSGHVYARKPNQQMGSYLRRRTPDDSRIKWDSTAWTIAKQVNALVDPLPNAFCLAGDSTVQLKRAYLGKKVGEVLARTEDGRYVIATKDGVILVKSASPLEIGQVLK
jgi:methionyl-tRNA formyltransferase